MAGPMGGMLMAEAKTFIETLKKSDVTAMIVGAVISEAAESGMRSRSTISASWASPAGQPLLGV